MSRITRTIRRCKQDFQKEQEIRFDPTCYVLSILTNCLIMHQTGTKDKRIDIVENLTYNIK